ncbi:MAG: DUF2019 domain-containing protein [Rhodopseudomonas sp.]|nr:DUF2019 domain-containing protein [Rhodopseudomonas sp.]
MKVTDLASMTVMELVDRFVELCLAQFQAELFDDISKENKLIRQSIAVADELKTREGDQRRALVPLFGHSNPQVRLMAAQFTLAVAPAESRQTLQEIWDRKEFPQAASALGTLWALERGDRKPT